VPEYRAAFKCRLCGKTFTTAITGNRDLAFSLTARLSVSNSPAVAQAPCLMEPHCCLNGEIGIADFLGWQLSEGG